MTLFLSKYGKIALALTAIFLSGQAIGWMLALHSCDARQEPASDSARWSAQMMARLQEDLGLREDQMPRVQQQLDAASTRLQQKRDSAMFQIHLELLKLHDDLAPGLSDDQKNKLAISRRKLVESTRQQFPELLRATKIPQDLGSPAESTSP